ncbi:hypothetical protein DJ530_02250 [Sulfolobus sp. E1]|uniref:hypothetical protein n=1 Tax=Saccharolobus sp. A20 TaxID=1891280 RepID=UPI0012EAEB89|nr:hypothetical protein [Sulfolobus sp. A20]TRN02212.1 hypothetical protein DJ527_04260 [Sulfolobus sp. F1]TRN03890.1 hypothetical protein DJ530_02250 [Sulfolobus sp. E1]
MDSCIISYNVSDNIKEMLSQSNTNLIDLHRKLNFYYNVNVMLGRGNVFKVFKDYIGDYAICVVANDDAVSVVKYRSSNKMVYWSQGALASIFFWKPLYQRLKATGKITSFLAVHNALKFSEYVSLYDLVLANSKISATIVSLFYNRNPEGVVYPPLDVSNYKFSKDKEEFALVILKRGYLSHVELLEKIAEKVKVKVIGAKIPGTEYLGSNISDSELKGTIFYGFSYSLSQR